MRIGVPTEVKNHEYRVALTPAGATELVAHGHEVLVQSGAGLGSALPDEAYAAAGARLVDAADDVWGDADLVLKVKEPVAEEYHRLRPGLQLFTYLHLAADKALTEELVAREVTALAYETVQTADGALPLLAPMSEVAGRLAPQAGAYHLMRAGAGVLGGRGVLMGGVPGTYAANVVVVGAGVAGMSAARVALGLGARVLLLDKSVTALRAADRAFGGQVQTVASSTLALTEAVLEADLVIGAVLVPGAKAPTLVSNDTVARMRPGAVLVDISVDQGGCFEDSHATTHADPTYRVHDATFYCVANMPGAVPHTSTYALTNVTVPYALAVADQGWRDACAADPALAHGLSTHAGAVTNAAVAAAHGMTSVAVAEVLG
ncbi:alanine dehydrogenase [Nocardioides sp. ChNu-153]|uniref:alanine dehydrogenase n=1 Tax=unclassified Nocardioides TaxID=2615069 RepID=UPI0024074A06|nr:MULTISPECIES: alanine dehydrogenase [unclassified Nocardioides]MDF9716220.1 alanine dehydrogenase [Nocardioides sp. ChNu-99]MDN7121610.1 alanine dehydrogenase [Nocardioides sp. ChNu-153]